MTDTDELHDDWFKRHLESFEATCKDAWADCEAYQQMLDEIVVALGSLGMSHPEIVVRVRELVAENDALRGRLDAAMDLLAQKTDKLTAISGILSDPLAKELAKPQHTADQSEPALADPVEPST